tara:strand:- start:22 stop:216 length:195 start_codon:yes stop_codon:yes gene_type:complete
MKNLKNAPTVNLNFELVIKELVGVYNENTQDLIHKIADNQGELLKGCTSLEDLNANVQAFINQQ